VIGAKEASEERAAAGLEANNEVTDGKEENKRKSKGGSDGGYDCDCGGGIAVLTGIRQSLVPSRTQKRSLSLDSSSCLYLT
jgi:hypothetical protein